MAREFVAVGFSPTPFSWPECEIEDQKETEGHAPIQLLLRGMWHSSPYAGSCYTTAMYLHAILIDPPRDVVSRALGGRQRLSEVDPERAHPPDPGTEH